ncbi:MAG TPA: CDP-alcohol phosphatidyltransferase family protein [Candidatus Xenobia bacterium]|nr:CDP-alcohol phosphatidyltransferase family protein [Candidatus Xenobia bacterium]
MVRKAVLVNLTLAPAAQTPRLAGLPVFLRAVLSAQRAGVEELLIAGGDDPAPLLRDKRVHLAWKWIPSAGSEIEALRAARTHLPNDFIILFADSVFDAAALKALASAPLGECVLRVARPDDTPEELEPAGASLYYGNAAVFAALDAVPNARRLAALYRHLRGEHRAESVALTARLWPRTSDRALLRSIHRELTHFNLKPSDGIFARFNKLVVAERLIRLFLKTPATPNFITGLGFAFAVCSAVAFAQGSYWWALGGALLAYFSGIMDHVDGMVARLKFQESHFGVYLESAADIGSYLCIFSGLAIGLYRESGSSHYLTIGGLFVFGTVLSFITLARQRRLASGDNPTDYPNRIHLKLEQHSRNFFHWFARKFYFLTRRAFLPYAILAFCLLDLRELLLAFVTLGANLVWILTLYNNRLFRGASRASAEAD